MVAKDRMKHTNHPNWKNLSTAEKQNVRRTNYRKAGLKKSISNLEEWIYDKRCLGESTFHLEGLLERRKTALAGNPFDSGNPDDNFISDLKNMILDYETNSGKR